jgi:spoIIIJ-associated protein
MEWVETTAKTVEEAKALALDQLGVHADEAEFEVLEEPKTGLFGRLRGEARVRARVRPTAVRPKQDRRGRRKREAGGGGGERSDRADRGERGERSDRAERGERSDRGRRRPKQKSEGQRPASSGEPTQEPATPAQQGEGTMEDQRPQSEVTPEQVGQAAVEFMSGLVSAFGLEATTTLEIDGTDLDVKVEGASLGLLVGPGGRTLMAIQDLARVASQRRLDDHSTRLRIDVAGYRERRRQALERFAQAVAHQVLESQRPKALEPMASADRKVVHDVVMGIDGVGSRSEGDEPARRVVIFPE